MSGCQVSTMCVWLMKTSASMLAVLIQLPEKLRGRLQPGVTSSDFTVWFKNKNLYYKEKIACDTREKKY